MSYVTQGKVQLLRETATAKKAVTWAFIVPAKEYCVKHDRQDYNVLIEQKNPQAWVYPAPVKCQIETYVEALLTEAAIRDTRVELQIEPSARGGPKIIGVKIPATVTI